jgi:hypothetical protein
MKAKKKPVVIDFFEITNDTFINHNDLKEWVLSFGDIFFNHFEVSYDPFEIKVKTLEGTSYDVTTDDMIMRGVSGELSL